MWRGAPSHRDRLSQKARSSTTISAENPGFLAYRPDALDLAVESERGHQCPHPESLFYHLGCLFPERGNLLSGRQASASGDRGALRREGVLRARPRAHERCARAARAAREASLPLCIAGPRRDERIPTG